MASDEGGGPGSEPAGTPAETPSVTQEQGRPETPSDAGALSEEGNEPSQVNLLLPGTEEAKQLEDRLNGRDQPGLGYPLAPGGDLASSSPAKTPAVDPAPAPDDGRNLWDFLSVAVVIAGLVGLTVFGVTLLRAHHRSSAPAPASLAPSASPTPPGREPAAP